MQTALFRRRTAVLIFLQSFQSLFARSRLRSSVLPESLGFNRITVKFCKVSFLLYLRSDAFAPLCGHTALLESTKLAFRLLRFVSFSSLFCFQGACQPRLTATKDIILQTLSFVNIFFDFYSVLWLCTINLCNISIYLCNINKA